MKTTSEIRSDFLNFFRERGHTIVPSAPLIPANDPTLLFTNSGMVQFKNVFLGSEKLPYVRAADVQRCLRAGGKHNDLDQVGYTARHHTFFEMLGNWSFGDYFKREAIEWAWELLTGVWKLPAERLLVTIYHTDDESFDIWNQVIGLPAERIIRIGDNKGAPFASDNFWQMADTGPCGPCTEIFYDHGEHIAGGPPGSPDEDGDRYIEIWNNVFMQFDRQPDGTLLPLPAPCVDTGMGLERIAAVLQGVHGNYDIDLFRALIAKAAELTGTTDLDNKSLRVIADHIRACSFLVVDGILPSNEGRGYVLRRIIRRALRHGYMLGQKRPFFHQLVPTLVSLMGEAYPELAAKQDAVMSALKTEEERFAETLESGMKIFDDMAAGAPNGVLAGADAFKLYDTYGFPLDLTQDIARERSLEIDVAGFDAAMEEQRSKARAAGKFGGGVTISAELAAALQPTQFLGYEQLSASDLTVVAILRDGQEVDTLSEGEQGVIILDRTPFYAESGGQIGDAGVLSGGGVRFDTDATIKLAGQFHGHSGQVTGGVVQKGMQLSAEVDTDRRQRVVRNHSATHLMHEALRRVLGEHVVQKGSLVAPDRLRFDFSHNQPVTREQIAQVERIVNDEVLANTATQVRHMTMDDAKAAGAMALFGEKYGDEVRVLNIGSHSVELCGGTHVQRTGDIGPFRIVLEGGVASGVRRIEAVTGESALDASRTDREVLSHVANLVGGRPEESADKVQALLDKLKQQTRELDALKAKAAASATADLPSQAVEVKGAKVLAVRIEGVEAKPLRELMDRLKDQMGEGSAIVLASAIDGKALLVAAVTGALSQQVKAGDLLSAVAKRVNGKGGGRADMAQGGGDDIPELQAALADVAAWVGERLP